MQKLYKGIFFVSFLVPSVVFAATQGSLGTTSTGTVNISIVIPSVVQVSGLSDINLSPVSFPITGNTTACIYSNISSPAGSYYVAASSSFPTPVTNFFRVNNGTNYIIYSAFWNNTSAATQTTPLTSGTKTVQQTGGSSTSVTCGGSPNANFNISFSDTNVQGVAAATYTDTVTLLITPT